MLTPSSALALPPLVERWRDDMVLPKAVVDVLVGQVLVVAEDDAESL